MRVAGQERGKGGGEKKKVLIPAPSRLPALRPTCPGRHLMCRCGREIKGGERKGEKNQLSSPLLSLSSSLHRSFQPARAGLTRTRGMVHAVEGRRKEKERKKKKKKGGSHRFRYHLSVLPRARTLSRSSVQERSAGSHRGGKRGRRGRERPLLTRSRSCASPGMPATRAPA